MDHKALSRHLIAAGILAGMGGVYIFYIYEPLHMLHLFGAGAELRRFLSIGSIALIGLLYLAALANYFKICVRIGENASFCTENAVRLGRIGRLLSIGGGCWTAIIAVLLCLRIIDRYLYLVLALAALASFCAGVVARVLGQLVRRASRLQEENDLTI